MKTKLITLIVAFLLLQGKTAFGQQAKSLSDTICTPVTDYANLVHNRDVLAEKNTLLLDRIVKLQEDNINLRASLDAVSKQINSMNGVDSIDIKTGLSYKEDAKTYLKKISENEKEIADLKKQLKKALNGKKWAAFGGLFTTAVATFFFITK